MASAGVHFLGVSPGADLRGRRDGVAGGATLSEAVLSDLDDGDGDPERNGGEEGGGDGGHDAAVRLRVVQRQQEEKDGDASVLNPCNRVSQYNTIQYSTTLLFLCRKICLLGHHLHKAYFTIKHLTIQ